MRRLRSLIKHKKDPMGSVREATHAGSWYSADEEQLTLQLDRWLELVPESSKCIGALSEPGIPATFPSQNARVIIAPHAGYSYSGKPAAWAYKALDLSKIKRIFVLGPSHHFYSTRCALSKCSSYATPLGDLELDHDTIAELKGTGQFDDMSLSVDEEEHSIEMHLPYIHKILSRTFSDYVDSLPPLIPILVGNTDPATERAYGQLLAPYLADPATAFIISSDFAHWGTRFRYTYYEDDDGTARNLRGSDRSPKTPPIYESIGRVDMRCIDAIESGEHGAFLEVLKDTGNTVCGRHPIGIVMAALEVLRASGQSGGVTEEGIERGKFRFVKYARSSDCVDVRDSSVSYASAYAVI